MVSLSSHLAQFSAFGFSGSRSAVPACVVSVFGSVPFGSPVFVGCAAGLDAAARSAFPLASVFRASQFVAASFAARLALRSVACVRAVHSVGGLWVSFPSSSCPPQLVPCASPFSGSGSGSWASLALAVFLRVHCVVLLPVGVSFPASWSSRCVVSSLGISSCGGSFFALSPLPVVSQSSLF